MGNLSALPSQEKSMGCLFINNYKILARTTIGYFYNQNKKSDFSSKQHQMI